MRTLSFSYHKPKTIQALRYHFISRKEIKVMMILVNVFALLTAALFFVKKISPLAFLTSSLLWFIMMILFWFLLPNIVFKKSSMFKDKFSMEIDEENLTLFNEMGSKSWPWSSFSFWMESPHFFHLYFNERSFLIFPKTAFDGDLVHEARNYFKNKIKIQGK
jgi:hypothetical protein